MKLKEMPPADLLTKHSICIRIARSGDWCENSLVTFNEILRRLNEAEALRNENEELLKDCSDMYDILINAVPAITREGYGETHESLIIENVDSVRDVFCRVKARINFTKNKGNENE